MPWLRPLQAILSLVLLAPACRVDREQTPHEREMIKRQRRARRRPDAAVEKKAPETPREKLVVVAMDREPGHLNPLLHISRWGYRIAMYNVYEPLLRRDPKTHEPRPHLATEWTVSPDGRVYRFTLRKDVVWHDGKPFTSRDVWYTIGRLHDRGTPMGPFRTDLVNELQQVDPLTPHVVRITLAKANSYLPDHLCELPMLPYHVFGRSIHRGHPLNRRPLGTGPFRFKKWIRGKEIQIERNPRYWGGVPAVREVRFQLISEKAKALTELKRGHLDILPRVARQHYPEQMTDWARRRFQEVWFDPPGFSFIMWNTRHPILADFRVRRAFTMLIDRQRIVKQVHHGLARIVAGPFWRPGGLGDPKLQPWPFDPVRARNLLDNAGWRDRDGDKIRDLKERPMRIVLLRPVTSMVMDDELKTMVAEFKRSGVALEPVQTDWRQMNRLLHTKKFMAAALHWRGRVCEDLSPLLHSSGKRNFGALGSLMMDRLLNNMRRALSRKSRAASSRKLERILQASQPLSFIHGPRELTLVHRRLKNVQISAEWIRLDRLRLE